jgi:hypothetical protein
MTCNLWGDNGGTRAAAPVLARLRGSSMAAGGAERQGAEHKQRRYGNGEEKGFFASSMAAANGIRAMG